MKFNIDLVLKVPKKLTVTSDIAVVPHAWQGFGMEVGRLISIITNEGANDERNYTYEYFIRRYEDFFKINGLTCFACSSLTEVIYFNTSFPMIDTVEYGECEVCTNEIEIDGRMYLVYVMIPSSWMVYYLPTEFLDDQKEGKPFKLYIKGYINTIMESDTGNLAYEYNPFDDVPRLVDLELVLTPNQKGYLEIQKDKFEDLM